jgi:aldose 1-epimerase
MKKLLGGLIVLTILLGQYSCTHRSDVGLFSENKFDTTLVGRKVGLYTLHSEKSGIYVQITNFGARVVSLWTPDKAGKYADIVLGYDNIESYIHNKGERFLGPIVGRYANRIAKGSFYPGWKDLSFADQQQWPDPARGPEGTGSGSLACGFRQ